ncbi:MAG: glycoside hydrolase family 43 protein [Phycisphaerales bacterium JB063]
MHAISCLMYLTVAFCTVGDFSIASDQAPADETKSDDAAPRQTSGNPLWEGWYADPEVCVIDGQYWIFPTTSARYDDQLFFDAFSSPDLVTWTKHERVLDNDTIDWAYRAMWAPCAVEKDGKTYLFFGANDLQRPGGPLYDPNDPKSHTGGIGVAVADSPEGPYEDLLGEPLIGDFYHDAQPIDQFVFQDTDGTWYIYYGGWGQCNVGILADDFRSIVPGDDGELFQNITPDGYVEGPVLFIRNDKYYFLWSEGGWGNDSYRVAYAIADGPTGPFERIGTILQTDRNVDIATGAGHNSVLNAPGTDDWYIVYHRRPIPNEGRDHRVTCIDKLEFNADGTIKPVVMTWEGVEARPLEAE